MTLNRRARVQKWVLFIVFALPTTLLGAVVGFIAGGLFSLVELCNILEGEAYVQQLKRQADE